MCCVEEIGKLVCSVIYTTWSLVCREARLHDKASLNHMPSYWFVAAHLVSTMDVGFCRVLLCVCA